MYFAIMKIAFDQEASEVRDPKTMKALAEKVRARFKVLALPIADQRKGYDIVISALHGTESGLSNLLDSIESLLEDAGLGRIENECTLMDHIDALDEFVGDDQSE